MNKEDLKSFYVAIILSALVVLVINYFFPKPEEPANVPAENAVVEQIAADEGSEQTALEQQVLSVEEALNQDARLPIKNNNINGSLRLKGARFDEIMLTKYKQTIDEDSAAVTLFAPAKTAESFFAEYGWLSANPRLKLPTKDTLWQVAEGDVLTPQTPVTLVWRNGEGLTFKYIKNG